MARGEESTYPFSPFFSRSSTAAFLFSLTPNIVLAAPAEQLALRWSELQPVLKGRQISVYLTDGAAVEGNYSSRQAGAPSGTMKD